MADLKRALRGAVPGAGIESNAILRTALADLGHLPVSYGHSGEQSTGVPLNMARPVISGTLESGQTLTVTNGAWACSPSSYTRQWKRDGVNIGSATNATYVLVTADEGTTITATITATNAISSASASSAGVAIPNPSDVASATRLLDIRASTLVLSDGDPVATWANAGTAGGSFTQTGSARPTYHAGAGHPYLQFDGVDDWMLGSAAINAALDNLPSFSVFLAMQAGSGSNVAPISKINVDVLGAGWVIDAQGVEGYIYQDNDNQTGVSNTSLFQADTKEINVFELLNRTTSHLYVNGSNTGEDVFQSGTPADYSNDQPVRLGNAYNTFQAFNLYAIRIYAPAPNASDSALIVADMAADCGVTL